MNFALSPKQWLQTWYRHRVTRSPAVYLVGETLSRLKSNLVPHPLILLASGHAELSLPDGSTVHIEERIKRLFMAHIVTCPFHYQGKTPSTQVFDIKVRHTGWLKRTGVRFMTTSHHEETQALIARLTGDAQLTSLLMCLDFRHCHLAVANQQWDLVVEHFSASDVVCRIPPLRRYLPLLATQRKALLMTILLFRQHLLHQPSE